MQTKEKQLFLHLTNRCTFRCLHCFMDIYEDKEVELNSNQIKTILKCFRKLGYRTLEITGGESVMSPNFKETIRLAQELGYNSIGVSTNGYQPKLVEQLKKLKVNRISFSVDGTKPISHDRLRIKGSFNKVIESIKLAVINKFYVYIVFTVHRYNYRETESIIRLAEKLMVDGIGFNLVSANGRAIKHPELAIKPALWLKIYQKITNLALNSKLTVHIPKHFTKTDSYDPDEVKYCHLNSPKIASVFPDGRVHFCCLLTDEKSCASGKAYDDHVDWLSNERDVVNNCRELGCPAFRIIEKKIGKKPEQRYIPTCIYQQTIMQRPITKTARMKR